MKVSARLRRALAATLRPFVYGARRMLERHVLGTKLHEWSWRWRHLVSPEVAEDHWASIDHPHRPLLLAHVAARAPTAVLEIGCNAGPNLYLLRRALPDARLYGIDINARAVAFGRTKLRESGMGNVELSVGSADQLTAFADRSVDVVLADAILMYVGPDKIQATLAELIRVARRAIVLNEWQLPIQEAQAGATHREHFGHWLHDYPGLLSGFPRVTSVQIRPVAPDVWRSRGWDEFGVIVEVELA